MFSARGAAAAISASVLTLGLAACGGDDSGSASGEAGDLAGDIAGAGHASATGRFDDEQLFYLRSRGISEQEARRLVVLGFLLEVVQKIGQPELESRLLAAIEAELAAVAVV